MDVTFPCGFFPSFALRLHLFSFLRRAGATLFPAHAPPIPSVTNEEISPGGERDKRLVGDGEEIGGAEREREPPLKF